MQTGLPQTQTQLDFWQKTAVMEIVYLKETSFILFAFFLCVLNNADNKDNTRSLINNKDLLYLTKR